MVLDDYVEGTPSTICRPCIQPLVFFHGILCQLPKLLELCFCEKFPAESQIATTWHTCSKHLSMWLCSGLLKSKMFFKTSSRHGARCLPSPPLQLRLAQFAQGFFGSVNMLSTKLVSLHVTSLSVYTAWTSLKMIPSLSAGFVAWCAPSSYQHK